MALDGLQKLVPVGTRLQVQFGVKRIELDEVAMGFPRRRSGTAIAWLAEVVGPLRRAVAQRRIQRNTLAQLMRFRREIENDPVGERPARRVGVLTNQGERSRVGGRVKPLKRRRDIMPVACAFSRNGLAFLKS